MNSAASRVRWSLCVFGATWIACSGGGGDPEGSGTVVKVEVETPAAELDALGISVQLVARASDAAGNPVPMANFAWSVRDPNVALISATGLLTTVANGTTMVRATSEGVVGETLLTVDQAADRLMVVVAPQGGPAGNKLSVQPVLEVQDRSGVLLQGDNATEVTAELSSSGMLLLQDEAIARQGVVRFTDLAVGGLKGQHTLTFKSPGLESDAATLTLTEGTPTTLVVVSGDHQVALHDTSLQAPIVVQLSDDFGNAIEGATLDLTVRSGGGSLDSSRATTDAAGRIEVGWTLGWSGPQVFDVQALALGLNLEVTALAVVALIHDVSSPLVEGQSAVISGAGFDSNPLNNTVIVDGVVTPVSSGDAGSLEFVVPTFDCLPARSVSLRVRVGAENTPSVVVNLEPAKFDHPSDGELLLYREPGEFCLQFPPSIVGEEFLLGVQSVAEDVTSLTPVQITVEAEQDVPLLQRMSAKKEILGSERDPRTFSPRALRMMIHRETEKKRRELDATFLKAHRGQSLLARGVRADALDLPLFSLSTGLNVGDQVLVRVRDDGGSCDDFTQITAEVRTFSTRSVWLEDIANPVGGFDLQDFDTLAADFDTIYTHDVNYFGDPSDVDSNGLIVVVVTAQVNKSGNTLGFVDPCDLFPRQPGSMGSNEGEYFYVIAPDSEGTVGFAYDKSSAFSDYPLLIAHEFAHVIQTSRRLFGGGFFMEPWVAEGGATLAEEIVGHGILGNSSGSNLGASTLLVEPGEIDWYGAGFMDLSLYFGFVSDTEQLDGAPHECSWLDGAPANTGPCLGGRQVYGVPWTFLRWISDQYGGDFPGGEGEPSPGHH